MRGSLASRSTRPRPFSPLSIRGCVGWFDANNIGTTLADGVEVDTWRDLSGGGNNLTGSGGARPVLKLDVQNGLSVVRFDGADDRMQSAAVIDTATVSVTAFFVVIPFAASQTGLFYKNGEQVPNPGLNTGWGVGTGSTIADIAGTTYLGLKEGIAWVADSGLTHSAAAELLAVQIGSDNKFKFWKGGGAGGLSAGTDAMNAPTVVTTIGADAFDRWWKGDVGEVIHYSAALSTTVLDRVGGYLAAKWGLSWAAAS